MVAKLEAESKRLKAELQKKQAEMIAKSVKSGGSGNSSGFGRGGGGTPPKAA
jgi:hypothetical protein